MGVLETIRNHLKFHTSLLQQFSKVAFQGREARDAFGPVCPACEISSNTLVIESMESTGHAHAAVTFSHI